MSLPNLPFAVFDEFGKSCEDRVADHYRAALAAQPGSVPAKNNDVDQLLRAVFELCEATEEAPQVEPKNEHQRGFEKGRRFEAKAIRRAVGDWFQATFCGRSFMGEPALNFESMPIDQVRPEWRGMMVAAHEKFAARPVVLQAADALTEIIVAAQSAKVALDAGIPTGEPVHPASARLTWPLSTAMMVEEKLRKLHAAAPTEAKPATQQASGEREIAGALFDFLGFLTTSERQWKFSAYDEASPAVEALEQWAKKRGLSLDEADVSGWRAALSTPAQQDAVDAAIPLDKDELAQLIAEHLGGAYHCTRVWEAWNVGTMSQDDFEPVDESETPTEIAEAIISAIRAAISAKKDGA